MKILIITAALLVSAAGCLSADRLPALADPRVTPLRRLPKESPWHKASMPEGGKTYYPAYRRFLEKEHLGHYIRHGVRDPQWDKTALEFHAEFLRKMHVANDISTQEMYTLAVRLLEADCRDPFTRILAFNITAADNEDRASKDARYKDQFDMVNRLLNGEATNYARLLAAKNGAVLVRNRRSMAEPQQFELFARQIIDAFTAILANHELPGKYAEEMAYRLWKKYGPHQISGRTADWEGRDRGLEEAFARQSDAFQQKFAGLLDVLSAETHQRIGWRLRGNGFADTVTEEGWQGFNEHLGKANILLRKAYEANPHNPITCQLMIQQGYQFKGEDGSAEDWFVKGIWARFDEPELYQNLMWAMRPRWGGSHEKMAVFAWQCLYTNRFSTWVPNQFPVTIDQIAEETGAFWRALYREPAIREALYHCYENYLASPDFADLQDDFRASYACTLMLCGDYAEALKQYELLPLERRENWKHRQHFRGVRFTLRLPEIPVAAELFAGEHGETLRAAEKAQNSGDLAAAAELFAEVWEACAGQPLASAYLRERAGECLVWSVFRGSYTENIALYRRFGRYRFTQNRAVRAASSINRPDIMNRLFAMGAEKGDEALRDSIYRNAHDAVRQLLEDGVRFGPSEHGDYPIHLAASYADLEMVKLVEQHEEDPHVTTDDGRTALHLAASSAYAGTVVPYLLSRGFDPGAETETGWTPLMFSAHYNTPEAARALLEAGASWTAPALEHNGENALHIAVRRGSSPDIARVLTEYGADPDISRADGRTALSMACHKGRPAMVEALIEAGADLNKEGDAQGVRPVHSAILAKRDNILAILLQAGASPDLKSRHNLTPFDIAVRYGNKSAAFLLLDHGVDVNQPSGFKRHTALHTAVIDGDTELLSRVLERQPNLNAPDHQQNTPLHLAAAAGRADMAGILIESGADLLLRNTSGASPSDLASAGGHAGLGSSLYWKEMQRCAAQLAAVPILAVILAAVLFFIIRRRRKKAHKALRPHMG